MEHFIIEANIENCRRRQHDVLDDKARALLTELLRAEEAELATLRRPEEER